MKPWQPDFQGGTGSPNGWTIWMNCVRPPAGRAASERTVTRFGRTPSCRCREHTCHQARTHAQAHHGGMASIFILLADPKALKQNVSRCLLSSVASYFSPSLVQFAPIKVTRGTLAEFKGSTRDLFTQNQPAVQLRRTSQPRGREAAR